MSWRKVKGHLHSYETCGLKDGPGVRVVVFLQGCPLRCVYCHNPDTWVVTDGQEVTAESVIKKVIRYKAYMAGSGGVTISGGEPLFQPEFLKALLKGCKEYGLHTAIDTAGYGHLEEETFENLDLVILDLKAPTNLGYYLVTGRGIDPVTKFMKNLEMSKHTRVWIRHVQMPDLNNPIETEVLLREWSSTLSRVDRFEIQPYHGHGVHKYKALNIPYPLEDQVLRAKLKQLAFP